MTDPAATVRATVHLAGSDEPQDEPLAHGFLVDARAVLVPDPPETACDPWQRYTVRIARDGEQAETLPVAGLRLAALSREAVRSSSAVLTLAVESRYRDTVVKTTLAALTESLHHHQGDLWAAYASLGYPVARPAGHPSPSAAAAEEHWWLESAVEDAADFAELICCPMTSCCHYKPPNPE